MAVFVWPSYLLFMTITSIKKNTKKGSASKRYKSQMARNTSDSHETTNRLLSWKKSGKVRKKLIILIIIIITNGLDKWVHFSAAKELWQRKFYLKHCDPSLEIIFSYEPVICQARDKVSPGMESGWLDKKIFPHLF